MGLIPAMDNPAMTTSAEMRDLMALQIDDFVQAASGGPGPQVTADIATHAIRLVERCSDAIQIAVFPWKRRLDLPQAVREPPGAPSIPVGHHRSKLPTVGSKSRPRFFVTGGTGFIGSRLVEVLRETMGADVTVLAHRTSAGALRLAAAGVPLNFTPLSDTAGLTKAVAGHDAIFHLAIGQTGTAKEVRETTVNGTRSLIAAALAAGVSRLINVSSAAVYSGNPDGEIDETAPRRAWGWSYADEKLAAEESVLQATKERGLKGSVFHVVGVYGPWGDTFVTGPLKAMRRGKIVLPNYGEGISNATYVDDVVQALILGLSDPAVGETFLIKGPGVLTRRETLGKLEEMLGYSGVEPMSTKDVKSHYLSGGLSALLKVPPAALSALRTSDEFKDAVRATPLAGFAKYVYRAVKPPRPLGALVSVPDSQGVRLIYPPKILINQLAARVSFSTAKAERILGYKPVVTLDEGMAITREWAQWANLLGPRINAA